MNKRTVGKIVVTSLLITSIWGINSYAYEGELYVDTLETVPAGSEDVLLDKGTPGNNEDNGIKKISDKYYIHSCACRFFVVPLQSKRLK